MSSAKKGDCWFCHAGKGLQSPCPMEGNRAGHKLSDILRNLQRFAAPNFRRNQPNMGGFFSESDLNMASVFLFSLKTYTHKKHGKTVTPKPLPSHLRFWAPRLTRSTQPKRTSPFFGESARLEQRQAGGPRGDLGHPEHEDHAEASNCPKSNKRLPIGSPPPSERCVFRRTEYVHGGTFRVNQWKT